MEPEMVRRPAFTVVGVKYRGRNQNGEIPRMWEERFFARLGEIANRTDAQIFYGVCGNGDETTGEFEYLAGAEVSSAECIPEGMDRWDIPEQAYAVFPCTLPTLMDAFDRAYSVWLPQSGYRHADGPEFEYYNEEFNQSEQRMYLYVPVVK